MVGMTRYLFPVASRNQFSSPLPLDACAERLSAYTPGPDDPPIHFRLAERGNYSQVMAFLKPGLRLFRLGEIGGEVVLLRQLDGRTEVSGFVLHRYPTVIAVWLAFAAVAGLFYWLAVLFTNLWWISLVIIYLAAFLVVTNTLVARLRRERQAILDLVERLLEGPIRQ